VTTGGYDYQAVPAGTYDLPRNAWSLRYLWHHRKFLSVVDSIKSMISGDSLICILDLGCGSGVFFRDYVEDSYMKVGYDISQAQLEYARKQNGKAFFSSDLEDIVKHINTMPKSLKVICVSVELLEHLSISEISEINSFLKRISRPIQGLVCTTPNRESFWPLLEKIIDRVLGTDYHLQHTNLMNANEFKEVSQYLSQGLLETSPTHVRSILGFKHWLFGWKPSKREVKRPRKMILVSERSNHGI